jgi:hypothetical protein
VCAFYLYLEKNMALSELHIEDMLPASFAAPGLSEAGFLSVCEKFPDATLERSEKRRSRRIRVQKLGEWAEKEGRGMVVGPDAGFFFPRGSRRSPDAAWFDPARFEDAEKPE